MGYKKKYSSHIAEDGFSDLMESYAYRGRAKLTLLLRLEGDIYRLWIDEEDQKAITQDFSVSHEGLDNGIKEFNNQLTKLKETFNMSPVADNFVKLEKARLDMLKARAEKQASRKPMKRTENNKNKLKALIIKMGLSKEEVIKILEEK
jgi:hypothetical protein